jgi:hypothetical protein
LGVESDDDVGLQGAQREEPGREVAAGVGEWRGGGVVGVADESAVVEVSLRYHEVGAGVAVRGALVARSSTFGRASTLNHPQV